MRRGWCLLVPLRVLAGASPAGLWASEGRGVCRCSKGRPAALADLATAAPAIPRHCLQFVVDKLVDFHGQQIILEVDGPSHFTSNLPYRVLGPTALRNNWAALAGWRLACVYGHDWVLCDSDHARKQHLTALLQAASSQAVRPPRDQQQQGAQLQAEPRPVRPRRRAPAKL
jgi:hypothetical protein